MPDTFVKIATVTVGSGGAASMDFTSIPSTYTDLCVKFSTRTNRASIVDGVAISFNGSSASFSGRYLESDSVTPYSATSTTLVGASDGTNATANTFGNGEVYIPNYAGSSYKSFSSDSVMENNATGAYQDLIAGLWSNTAAITSLSILPLVGTLLLQYSTATLYGISKS
jgi:hypothetical protein